MRRFIIILAAALCFLTVTACDPAEILGEIAAQLTETEADITRDEGTPAGEVQGKVQEDGSASDIVWDANVPAADESESASDALPAPAETSEQSPAPAADESVGFAALSPEECITDFWPETPGVLPRIVLDCPGADTINAGIQAQFSDLADDPMWEVHYECCKGSGHILSIVIVRQMNDSAWYTPYNLDLDTGEALDGGALLALLGVDGQALAELETALLGDEFTYQYGGMQAGDPDFYAQQYARTTDPANTDIENVWFSGDGQLCFLGRIYNMVGAESSEYPIGTGMFF